MLAGSLGGGLLGSVGAGAAIGGGASALTGGNVIKGAMIGGVGAGVGYGMGGGAAAAGASTPQEAFRASEILAQNAGYSSLGGITQQAFSAPELGGLSLDDFRASEIASRNAGGSVAAANVPSSVNLGDLGGVQSTSGGVMGSVRDTYNKLPAPVQSLLGNKLTTSAIGAGLSYLGNKEPGMSGPVDDGYRPTIKPGWRPNAQPNYNASPQGIGMGLINVPTSGYENDGLWKYGLLR
jgi:hypothetical protein